MEIEGCFIVINIILGAGDSLQDHRPVRQPIPVQPHQAPRPLRCVWRPLRDAGLQAQALQGQDQVEELLHRAEAFQGQALQEVKRRYKSCASSEAFQAQALQGQDQVEEIASVRSFPSPSSSRSRSSRRALHRLKLFKPKLYKFKIMLKLF